jgi:hypothetical protein
VQTTQACKNEINKLILLGSKNETPNVDEIILSTMSMWQNIHGSFISHGKNFMSVDIYSIFVLKIVSTKKKNWVKNDIS